MCNGQWVTFYRDFTLAGSGWAGDLHVMADDTANVWINGTQVEFIPTTDPYTQCSGVPVGCIDPKTVGNVSLTSYLNQGGTNRLVFQVFQMNGAGFGLDYTATLSTVPETRFLWRTGLGIVGTLLCNPPQAHCLDCANDPTANNRTALSAVRLFAS